MRLPHDAPVCGVPAGCVPGWPFGIPALPPGCGPSEPWGGSTAKTTPAEGSSRQAPMVSETIRCFISGFLLRNCNKRTIHASAGAEASAMTPRYAAFTLEIQPKRGRQEKVPKLPQAPAPPQHAGVDSQSTDGSFSASSNSAGNLGRGRQDVRKRHGGSRATDGFRKLYAVFLPYVTIPAGPIIS